MLLQRYYRGALTALIYSTAIRVSPNLRKIQISARDKTYEVVGNHQDSLACSTSRQRRVASEFGDLRIRRGAQLPRRTAGDAICYF